MADEISRASVSLVRWKKVCAGLGTKEDPSAIYDELVSAYSEPHRAYHTLAHLESCLREFDSARRFAADPNEIEAALWFHDAIYDTHRSDNEEHAALWASTALSRIGISTPHAKRVEQLVLATRHHEVMDDADAAMLLDIDLSILGKPQDQFDLYEGQVRREYAWVSADDFRHARGVILDKLLERPRIYQTDFFHARYEAQARDNLARSLVKLRGEGTG
ncbi:MAG TPA: N-methyl-D-aspartate receptor NMDAR2C subunit [Candidatus Binatia bacterium]|jgi:predicted metal-dependent HD superfamily phosphohydrolase